MVIEKPHKKSYTYSSIDTKVNGRKQLPHKTAGELFFPPNLHLLTLLGNQVDVGLAGELFFPAKPTSTHSSWKMSRCRFGGRIIFLLPNLHLLTLLGK
jgi:hypothetical protein